MSEVDLYCIVLILPAFFISSSASLHMTNSRLASPRHALSDMRAIPTLLILYFRAITLNMRRGGEASRV